MRWPLVSRAYAELLRQELDRARDELAHLREVHERLVGSALVARGIHSPYAPPTPVEPPQPIGRRNAAKMIAELEARDRELAGKMKDGNGHAGADDVAAA